MAHVVVNSTEGGLKHQIRAGAHTLASDAPRAVGGDETAPDPHELLLASLGGCTSMTMLIYARRHDWDLSHVSVTLADSQVDDPAQPGRKMTRITRTIEVEGNLSAEQVEQLKAIADRCPVHKILAGPKEVVTAISKR